MSQKEYIVEGMTCNHCKKAVEDAASQIEGVTFVEAFPSENKLIVEGKPSEERLKEVIDKLGYTFKLK